MKTATKKQWLKEFARRLNDRMEELNMNQYGLAKRTGLQQSHICRLTHGLHSPSGWNIVKIADALGVEPSYLIDF